MKSLLLNTACKNAEILLLNGERFSYRKCGEKAVATENLLPVIDSLLDDEGLTLADIDVFGCVSGPGSFTGIRVGITTIRAFAYACGKPCMLLDYFDILFQNATWGAENVICLVDGGNKMKYLSVRDAFNNVLLDARYVDEETIGKFIAEIDEPYCIVADFPYSGKNVVTRPIDGSDFIVASRSKQRDGFVSFSEVVPLYVAKSQAERDKGL